MAQPDNIDAVQDRCFRNHMPLRRSIGPLTADCVDPAFEAVHDGGRKAHPRNADPNGANAHRLQVARRDPAARHAGELVERAILGEVARERAVNDRDGLFGRHRDERNPVEVTAGTGGRGLAVILSFPVRAEPATLARASATRAAHAAPCR